MDKTSSDIQIPRKPIPFMLYTLRPYIRGTVFVILVATAAQLCASSTALIARELIDAMTSAPTREGALAALKMWGGLYVIVTFVMYGFWRLSGILGVMVLSSSKAYSYEVLFKYLTGHSYAYFSNRFAGAVANKISHASDGADNLFEQIVWHYYPNALGLVATNIFLFMTSVWLGGIFLSLCILVILVNIYLVKRRRPLVIAYAESASVLRGISVDAVSNIFAVMQYVRQPFELARVRSYVEDRRVKDVRRDMSAEWGLLINNILVVTALIAITFVVYFGFREGTFTLGDVIMTITLLYSTVFSLIFIGNMLNGFIRTYGEIEEGLAEIIVPYEVVDHAEAQVLQVAKGGIDFKMVDFSYEHQSVFRGLDIAIAPGERVGLVGTSGAGKTTLVSLLLRQHDIQDGAIEIDGQDIAQVTQDSLRDVIALVPQEPQLFHRTIKENIAYGREDATLAEIEEAASRAHAHEFIMTLPQGYDTMVGERGVKLSGGQRQRIAIARAILKHAPILVLDEATSALDSVSEVAIQEALHELMEGKTVIAIAHRLSTLREMDRILVLKEGVVAESGTHDELLAKKDGIYAELWGHQVGGFIQEGEETIPAEV